MTVSLALIGTFQIASEKKYSEFCAAFARALHYQLATFETIEVGLLGNSVFS